MYTMIGGPRSRAFRVIWMLEELGLDYKHVLAAPRSDEVTAHYPVGKLPVLLEDDTVLTDSVAIMTYLADKHGALTCAAGTLERAQQDGHTQFLNDELDALLWMAAKHSFVLPEEHRIAEVKDSLKWEYARSLERLEARIGDGPYLMGDQMTLADMLAAHCCRWAANAKFPEPTPAVQGYLERLTSRPAYLRALKTQ
ncbi:Glutathione S-transferase [Candidatus Rhodobacter oscarellae]|uniref:Glutathione S-transferase n=1 Tax=Candidatus Rhodobacter oscarellae TaxID=1675527 RepID=A0A0J9E7F5_9RHOB|nr:glutathione S-transferase family protein [Candidatus Rhodobacter lobularis]KMW58627.1 Glutathione S-transferase [Candidatus Rhodobacter lobularis]